MSQKTNLSFSKSRRAQSVEDYETWIEGGVVPTLNAFDNGGESRATVLIIDATRVGDIRVYEDGIVPTVIQRYGTGGGNVPMIFPTHEIIGTLQARDYKGLNHEGARDGKAIIQNSTVRRLTPLECERLQGFPDGFTAGQADSNRYCQMGNAVAVPVVEWIVSNLVRVTSKGVENER